MQTLIEMMVNLGPWAWLALALLLLTLETIIPGVHFAWFGLAAAVIGAGLMALGAAGVMPIGLVWQVAAFAVLSAAMVWWFALYGRQGPAQSDVPGLNRRGDQLVGRIVVVETMITGGRGRVRVGDSVWGAQSASEIAAGDKARVTGSDGAILNVEPV